MHEKPLALRRRRSLRPRRGGRRSVARRTFVGLLRLVFVLSLVIGLAAGVGIWRLAQGPISFAPLAQRVAAALSHRFGEGFTVNVARAQLGWSRGPVLTVADVVVRDPEGHVVVASPSAEIGFDPLTLAGGVLVPRNISFVGLSVTLIIAPDGTVTVSAADRPDHRAVSPDPDAAAPADSAPVPASPDTRFGPGRIIDAIVSPEGPAAVLQRAGIREGRLVVDDRRRGHGMVYDHLAISYTRGADGENALVLSAAGPSGPLAFSARVKGSPGAERTLKLDTRNLALSELLAVVEPGSVPLTSDVKLSANLSLSVGADDSVTAAEGSILGGNGTAILDDPDARPFPVDSLALRFGWDAGQHRLSVDELAVKSGATDLHLRGTVSPPGPQRDHWDLALTTPGSTWTPVGEGDPPIRLDRFDVDARMPIGLGALVVDRLEVGGPDVSFRLSASFGRDGDFDGVRMKGSAGRMPARTLMAFWPNYITADVRSYLAQATRAGTMDRFEIASQLTQSQIADNKARKPLPDDVLKLDFAMSGAAMRFAPGLPALTDGIASGHVTGRRAEIAVSRARLAGAGGQDLLIGQGSYVVADTAAKPAVAEVRFSVAGGLEPLMETLRSDALHPFVALPPGVAGLKGQLEATIGLTLTFVPKMGPKDVVVEAQGNATGVAADAVFGKEKLENGNFSLVQDRSGLLVKGDARIGGSPALIEVRQPAGAATADTNAVITLDDAARVRRNIRLPGQLTGPVDVKVALHDTAPGKPAPPRIELDLTRAAITDVLPGWTKAAGKPAKASFKWVAEEDTVLLDEFALDGGAGVAARGSVRLGQDGTFLAARLPSLKIAAVDDMKVEAERAGSTLRLAVRGGTIDARPILRSLVSPGGTALGSPGDLDLDLKASSVIGQNGEVLTGADLKLSTRGGEAKDLRLSGRLGGAAIAGQTARGERGGSGIVIEGGDAGAFFRYLDIYRRMRSGALLVQLSGASPQTTGVVTVSRFVLDDEPALARSVRPGDERATGPSRVQFTKLKAGFSAGGGRLQITDATMWGPTVGGTIDGTMDFARDTVNLSGTFVPAYGLNNMFNRVPIVGPILGGGQNEGLFAVNFKITGRVSQPTLSINPLSAVAPGFLRKFFGVFGPDATSSTAPPRPEDALR